MKIGASAEVYWMSKHELAEQLQAQGKVDEAIDVYRRILEYDDREDWRAHLGLGDCYFKKQMIKDGLGHYQELTRLAPKEGGPAYLARAELKIQRGEEQSAARMWFHCAAHAFLKKGETQRYQTVCQRILELGFEPLPALDGLERAMRSLTGLWIGDAFGGSFFWKEDLSQRILSRELSPSPWLWSDDTAMGRSVFTCLDRHDEIVPDELAKLFADEYRREPTRGYGTMAHTVLHDLGQGTSWQDVAGGVFDGKGSYGNGAAMRVGPVGAYFCHDIEQVLEQARLSAGVTHAHPEGQAGALACAAAAAWAAKTQELDGRAMLEWAWSHTPAGQTRSNLESALKFPLDREPEQAAALLGSGQQITSQDTVGFSLWCAARHLDSLPEALWATVAGGGDMDTTCAIVGSIVVLCAHDGIPPEWLTHAEPM